MIEQGYTCEVVERHLRHSPTTKDLFGIIDLLALHPETGETVGVQSTTFSNRTSRIKKIEDSGLLPLFRACGWGIVVHAWRERGDCDRTWLLKPVTWARSVSPPPPSVAP